MQKEPTPVSSEDNASKEAEVTSPPEPSNPKDSNEKPEETPSEKPQQTTQPEEQVTSEKTEDEQIDVAKRKKESDSVSEKPVEVVPETTPAKLDTDEKIEDSRADERDNVNEADDVESENSKNKEGKPNPKDNKIQLKYSYREGNLETLEIVFSPPA